MSSHVPWRWGQLSSET